MSKVLIPAPETSQDIYAEIFESEYCEKYLRLEDAYDGEVSLDLSQAKSLIAILQNFIAGAPL